MPPQKLCYITLHILMVNKIVFPAKEMSLFLSTYYSCTVQIVVSNKSFKRKMHFLLFQAHYRLGNVLKLYISGTCQSFWGEATKCITTCLAHVLPCMFPKAPFWFSAKSITFLIVICRSNVKFSKSLVSSLFFLLAKTRQKVKLKI